MFFVELKRLKLAFRGWLALRGLDRFRAAAKRDGFDYSGISDEHLFMGIGVEALTYVREHGGETVFLFSAFQHKVGLPASDLILRALDVAEEHEIGSPKP